MYLPWAWHSRNANGNDMSMSFASWKKSNSLFSTLGGRLGYTPWWPIDWDCVKVTLFDPALLFYDWAPSQTADRPFFLFAFATTIGYCHFDFAAKLYDLKDCQLCKGFLPDHSLHSSREATIISLSKPSSVQHRPTTLTATDTDGERLARPRTTGDKHALKNNSEATGKCWRMLTFKAWNLVTKHQSCGYIEWLTLLNDWHFILKCYQFAEVLPAYALAGE